MVKKARDPEPKGKGEERLQAREGIVAAPFPRHAAPFLREACPEPRSYYGY